MRGAASICSARCVGWAAAEARKSYASNHDSWTPCGSQRHQENNPPRLLLPELTVCGCACCQVLLAVVSMWLSSLPCSTTCMSKSGGHHWQPAFEAIKQTEQMSYFKGHGGRTTPTTTSSPGRCLCSSTSIFCLQVSVPILGVVENMSYFECAGCGRREHIFGDSGAARMAEELGVQLLGQVRSWPQNGPALKNQFDRVIQLSNLCASQTA